MKNNLVDELRLKIHPLILGKGKKLFEDDAMAGAFELVESVVTVSGVVIAGYERKGRVKVGRVG